MVQQILKELSENVIDVKRVCSYFDMTCNLKILFIHLKYRNWVISLSWLLTLLNLKSDFEKIMTEFGFPDFVHDVRHEKAGKGDVP